jgi:hypothetical protein
VLKMTALETKILAANSKEQLGLLAQNLAFDTTSIAFLCQQSFHKEYRLTQRCTILLIAIQQINAQALTPHFETILSFLGQKTTPDFIKRNVLKLAYFCKAYTIYPEPLLQYSILFLETKEAVAIQAYSMMLLQQLLPQYPELSNTVTFIIKTQLPYQKPAFKARAKMLLKAIKKQSNCTILKQTF